METTSIDIKKMYQNFIENDKAYYEKRASFNDPQEMVFQYRHRDIIMGGLCDLVNDFVNKSYHVLDAFSEYEENQRKNGINAYKLGYFNSIICATLKLINEKEEIDKWSDDLGNVMKLLEEKNVPDMEPSDI